MSRKTRSATLLWLAMLAITLAAWLFAVESSQLPIAAFLLLLAVALKGLWLVDDFMGLRYCKPIWRRLLLLWLSVVLSFVGLCYFWSLL